MFRLGRTGGVSRSWQCAYGNWPHLWARAPGRFATTRRRGHQPTNDEVAAVGVIKVTDDTFHDLVLCAAKPVLVDCYLPGRRRPPEAPPARRVQRDPLTRPALAGYGAPEGAG